MLTRVEKEKFGEFDKEKREGEDQECELQIRVQCFVWEFDQSVPAFIVFYIQEDKLSETQSNVRKFVKSKMSFLSSFSAYSDKCTIGHER